MFSKDQLLSIDRSKYSPHQIIQTLIKESSTVLDVGCNTGFLGKALKQKGVISDGVDINKKALKIAKKYYRHIYKRDLYQPRLNIDKKLYDYIILADVLEHLPQPDLLLKNCRKYLKNDGRIIVSLPNIARLEIRLKLLLGKFDYTSGIISPDHLRFFTHKTAIKMMEESGFIVEKTIPTGLGKITKLFSTLTAFQFIYIIKKNEEKKVSLVVINHNGQKHLREYFLSIFKQTLIPDEVLMIDNASTDDSIEYVKKYFPKVKIIANKHNSGTAEGSNIAFKHSKGDYVIFQSNDIRLDKNCVKELVKTLAKNPKIGIVTSVLINYYQYAKTHKKIIDNAGGDADIFGFGTQKYPFKKLGTIPKQEEVFFSYGGSFIIRRKIYEKVGGFDQRYFTLNDDIDLSWRVRLLGYQVVYNKESVVYHKVSATLGLLFDRATKRYWSERNNLRTLLKNHKLINLAKILPLYFSLLLGEMGYFLYRRRFSLFFSYIKALAWNLYYLPETLVLRQRIQKIKTNQDVDRLLIRRSLKLKLFNDFKKAI